MGQAKHIIEVNGKRYDAITGAVITTDHRPVAKSAANIHSRTSGSHRSIDGFARMGHHRSSVAATAPSEAPAAAKPAHHVTHTPASHVAHHKQQRAMTLMRSAVKKPAREKPLIKTQDRTDAPAHRPSNALVPKLSYGNVDPLRHQRASQAPKSAAVSHFGTIDFAQPTLRSAVKLHSSQTLKSVAPHKPSGSLDFIAAGAMQPSTMPQPRPATAIFEQAIANAEPTPDVFEELRKPRARKRKRVFGIVSATVAVLLLAGAVGYTNISQLKLTVASYRSGVHAKLPTYKPGDYAFNSLDYKPGAVTASFVSPTSNQEFNISQRASNWDSQALLSNVVTTANKGYKTYQRAGRTVYILSNNTATWVDSGILYTVEGNAQLSSNQLLDLASSM